MKQRRRRELPAVFYAGDRRRRRMDFLRESPHRQPPRFPVGFQWMVIEHVRRLHLAQFAVKGKFRLAATTGMLRLM